MAAVATRKLFLAPVAFLPVLLAVACGGEVGDLNQDSASVYESERLPADAHPYTGEWTTLLLLQRLESAGLVPRKEDTTLVTGTAAQGELYRLGRDRLQLFLYPDSIQAAADAARIESDTVRLNELAGGRRATVVRSINVVAVLLSESEVQIERVQNALLAGLWRPDTIK